MKQVYIGYRFIGCNLFGLNRALTPNGPTLTNLFCNLLAAFITSNLKIIRFTRQSAKNTGWLCAIKKNNEIAQK